jgi:hypothetical protein
MASEPPRCGHLAVSDQPSFLCSAQRPSKRNRKRSGSSRQSSKNLKSGAGEFPNESVCAGSGIAAPTYSKSVAGMGQGLGTSRTMPWSIARDACQPHKRRAADRRDLATDRPRKRAQTRAGRESSAGSPTVTTDLQIPPRLPLSSLHS